MRSSTTFYNRFTWGVSGKNCRSRKIKKAPRNSLHAHLWRISKVVDACRLAHRAGEVARRANQRLVEAQIEGGYWIDALKDIATEKSNEAARRLIAAHIASEEAQGAVAAHPAGCRHLHPADGPLRRRPPFEARGQ
jgi:hypothetical protein